jgi:hypothetical protein
LALVANGQANLAAIDCIAYALLARFKPKSTDGTRILAQSDAAPAPPYVGFRIRSESDVEWLRVGLLNAMIDPQLEDTRGDLFLTGIKVLSAESYGEIPEFTAKSARYGYRDFDSPK